MKVGVGSKNKTKVDAVAQTMQQYPKFADAEIAGIDVQIEEFGHPKGFDDIVAGAVERAKQAYAGNDYGFGIESGLVPVPQTKSGYLEAAICAIWDGRQVHIGMSPGLEWPTKAADGILNKGYDGSQAMREAGITNQQKIGAEKGMIHLVSDGQMDRTEYNKFAVLMAIVHLLHPELYQN